MPAVEESTWCWPSAVFGAGAGFMKSPMLVVELLSEYGCISCAVFYLDEHPSLYSPLGRHCKMLNPLAHASVVTGLSMI